MNIKSAKKEISNCIKAYLSRNEKGEYRIPTPRQRPIFLVGPPGIGKTAIMEQVASENKIALVSYTITHHTRESAVGMPQIVTMHYNKESFPVTTYTMSEIIAEIYRKMNLTSLKEGILFLDEINCVDESLAPSILQFLQFKTFGTHKIPEGWIIAVAGNPEEFNNSVKEFDIVTLDRLKRMEVEPDFGVWREYAYKNRLKGAIISYLYNNPDKFYYVNTDPENKIFVTARGWEDLSDMLNAYESFDMDVTEYFIMQYIQHPRIAEDFCKFYYSYKKLTAQFPFEKMALNEGQDDLIAGIKSLDIQDRNSVIISLITALAGLVYECEYQKLYASYVLKMADEVGKIYEKSRTNYRSDSYSVTEEMRRILGKQKEANFLSRNEIAAINNAIKFLEDIALKYASGAEEMLYVTEIYQQIQKEFAPVGTVYEKYREDTINTFENVCCFAQKTFTGEDRERYMKEFCLNYHITNFIENESDGRLKKWTDNETV